MNDQSIMIHVVTQATASLLADVDADVFDNPVSPALLYEYLSNLSNALIVATLDGRVIGMATGIAYVHPDKPKSLFINEVGVSARFHRRGIGTRLLAAMLEWGRNQGCVEAWVAASVDNVAAQLFYKATGGVEDAQHAVVYTYPIDTSAHQSDKQ